MSSSKSPSYVGAGSTDFTVAEAIAIVENKAEIVNHATTAERFAQLSGTTVVNANTSNDTGKYSAFEYAQGTSSGTGGSAKDFAIKIDGGVHGDTSSHSAKAWAIGGTGVTNTGSKGASKEWATTTGSTVDTSEYSAKEYAVGTAVPAGSAKDWAIQAEDSAVTGSNYSALHHASKAAASATAASSSQSAAATSATTAETAKNAVETIFDNFDDRFLGTKTSDPSADNDGNSLSVGAMYYNSSAGSVRFYNGSAWDNPSGSASTYANQASASATSAATSATNAASSASVSSSSATASATSANSSSTSATASASSATAAASSATSAAASYDAFDDRYLGSKSSDPGTDNDGNTLIDGALYWNTTNNILKVYDLGNTSWVQTVPSSANQNHINTLTTGYDGTTSTSGTTLNMALVNTVSTNVGNVFLVGNNISNVNTVAGISSNVTAVANDATDIGAVAGKATEIGLLGTSAMATASSGHLALLGTDAMANPTTGKLKLVVDNLAGINAFLERYRIASSAPSSNNDEGDLYYNTNTNNLYYYDGSAWQSMGITLAQAQTEANNSSVAMSIALG